MAVPKKEILVSHENFSSIFQIIEQIRKRKEFTGLISYAINPVVIPVTIKNKPIK